MHRMIEARLRKLEDACPDRRKRMFVLDGATNAERPRHGIQMNGYGG